MAAIRKGEACKGCWKEAEDENVDLGVGCFEVTRGDDGAVVADDPLRAGEIVTGGIVDGANKTLAQRMRGDAGRLAKSRHDPDWFSRNQCHDCIPR